MKIAKNQRKILKFLLKSTKIGDFGAKINDFCPNYKKKSRRKNTLTKIAAKNAGLGSKFDEILEGQIAIAFSIEDATAPARVIKNFSKTNLKIPNRVRVQKTYNSQRNPFCTYVHVVVPNNNDLLLRTITHMLDTQS